MSMIRGASFYYTDVGHEVTLKGSKDKWTVITFTACEGMSGHRSVTIKHNKTKVVLEVFSKLLGPSKPKKGIHK